MSDARLKRCGWLACLLYLLVLVLLASQHEMWRDEVRAWSIVQSSGSIRELMLRLKNEGHPSLWYLLLYLGDSFTNASGMMPALSITIAVLAGAVFIFFAPFAFPLRVAWLFGLYPMYEYSIMCRNYGIGMLALFCFLALYERRAERPWLLAFSLVALAQSNAFAWILAAALSLALCFDAFRVRSTRSIWPFIGPALLVFASLLLAVYQMMPDRQTVVTPVHETGAESLQLAVVEALIRHGSSFHNAFSLPFPWAVPLILFGTYVLCFRRLTVLVFLFVFTLGMELFDARFYSAQALRHQGVFLLGLVAALWMGTGDITSTSKTAGREQVLLRVREFGFALIVMLQIYAGLKSVRLDFYSPMSSAPDVAAFVASDPSLGSAVFMSEPDYWAETLPFYLSQDIYFPREKKFKRYVSFTQESKSIFSLSELLSAAEEVARLEYRVVLLLLPNELTEGEIQFLYGRKFVMDAAGLRQLASGSKKLVSFTRAVTDENYSLWKFGERSP